MCCVIYLLLGSNVFEMLLDIKTCPKNVIQYDGSSSLSFRPQDPQTGRRNRQRRGIDEALSVREPCRSVGLGKKDCYLREDEISQLLEEHAGFVQVACDNVDSRKFGYKALSRCTCRVAGYGLYVPG
jgi:hypothetical protein